MHHREITSSSPTNTEALAKKIGLQLKGGEVIELVSDLGGGKTTFVHGLAAGFGSTDKVASPTYTISKVYKANGKEMHHFDFYRLDEAGLMSHELAEVIGEADCVVVVEWGEVVHDVLPAQRLKVTIKRTGEDMRSLEIDCPEDLKYLLKELS
jgi:tRNA threonylcarbamoyladenosine biosynthesis protein TsaE